MIPLIGALMAAIGCGLFVFGVSLYDTRAAMVLAGIICASVGTLIMVAAARVRRDKGQ